MNSNWTDYYKCTFFICEENYFFSTDHCQRVNRKYTAISSTDTKEIIRAQYADFPEIPNPDPAYQG